MLSESSSISASQSRMCSSRCSAVSLSSFRSSATFSSRSNTLTAYQRRNCGSTLFSMLSSIWASACSTLPPKTAGSLVFLLPFASSIAFSAALRLPSPFRAAVSTISQPSSEASFWVLISSPFLRTRSIILTATTTGMPSSISWVVRYRFLSIFVPSTILIIASGFSFTR